MSNYIPQKLMQLLIHALISMNHVSMMTSSNGNIFRVTGPLCGEFTGHRWLPHTKAIDAELWCFLWSAPWINGWVNNREAGDLRRHRAHYDVIVMVKGTRNVLIYRHVVMCWNIAAETKLPIFRRRNVQMHHPKRKQKFRLIFHWILFRVKLKKL